VRDNLDMTMTYVFGFYPPDEIKFIVDNYAVLPRPAGVLLNYVIAGVKKFGFGSLNLNFNNGNFTPPPSEFL
jgi:hypothetical protein